MTNGITLLETMVRLDAWFLGSFFRWGMLNTIATVVLISTFLLSLTVHVGKRSQGWFVAGWCLVVLQIVLRAKNQLYSILVNEQMSRVVGAEQLMRLVADALILPSLFSAALLIRRRHGLMEVTGRWQGYLLIIAACTFCILVYVLVRLADWLTGSVGLIGI